MWLHVTEEFAVILNETSEVDARRLAVRFLDAVRGMRVAYGGETLLLTASVGVGQLTEGESGAELLARTDHALYRAKSSGRDRAVDAEPRRASGCLRIDAALVAKHRTAS
jgi:diguanylate cyclase (GGDEF)-like protein